MIDVLTIAVFHNDDEWIVAKEAFFVGDNVWVVKIFKKPCLHHATRLLLVAESFKYDFLCHILFIILLFMLNDKRSAYILKLESYK